MSKIYVREVYIKNWRNIGEVNLKFSSGINVIFGKNAQGKTSLLEAIGLLGTGRSFRTSRLDECIGWTDETALLRGVFESDRDQTKVNISLSSEKKEIRLNSEPINRLSELFGRIPLVEILPSDFSIVDGDPATRRRFLDQSISQQDRSYFHYLMNYKRVLHQRNKDLFERGRDPSFDLRHWDDQLVSYGSKLISRRASFIEALNSLCVELYQEIASVPEVVRLRYETSIEVRGLEMIAEAFQQALSAKERADRATGTTSVGPHREDITLFIGDKPARQYASQGQKRAMAIALKIALGDLFKKEANKEPVYLVDDVFSELDRERRKRLKGVLSRHQAFIAVTDINDLEGLTQEFNCYEVNQGQYALYEEFCIEKKI